MTKIISILIAIVSLTQAHIDEKVLYAFAEKCMVCHDTYEKNKLAPPLVAVNQVYLRLNENNMTKAIESIKTFLTSPDANKTLMAPAVKLFGVMPKLDLSSTEIDDFSQILIETEFKIPDWFDGHYRSHELNTREEK